MRHGADGCGAVDGEGGVIDKGMEEPVKVGNLEFDGIASGRQDTDVGGTFSGNVRTVAAVVGAADGDALLSDGTKREYKGGKAVEVADAGVDIDVGVLIGILGGQGGVAVGVLAADVGPLLAARHDGRTLGGEVGDVKAAAAVAGKVYIYI